MKPTIEGIAILILDALEEERQREPNLAQCRPISDVLGEVMSKHGLENADIDRGLEFCIERGYIDAVTRQNGQAMLPSIDGVRIIAQIHLERAEEERKKKRHEEFEKFDPQELSKMDAKALAAWQMKYEKDDPQYKFAEHEWELRKTKGTRKISTLALAISVLSLLVTLGFNLYDRLHSPPDKRMLVTLTINNTGKAEIAVQPNCAFQLTVSAQGTTSWHQQVAARLTPIHLRPGENGFSIPPRASRDFQMYVSEEFRNQFESGAGQLDISGGITAVGPFNVSVPFYTGGMTATVNIP